MVFYEVEILTPPKILFALRVESEKYKNHFEGKENYLEISFCEYGEVVFEHRCREKEIARPNMLVPILKDLVCDTYPVNGGKICHVTVGVDAEYNIKRYDDASECDVQALSKRMNGGNIMLIPYFYDLEDNVSVIVSLLKKLIAFNSAGTPDGAILTISSWYKLCSELTKIVYAKLCASKKVFLPSEQMYVNKAIRIIEGINKNQLTIKEIAESLNISEGYLRRIFKKIMGTGIVNYINRQRIITIIELVENKNLSLHDASLSVGIEDPAYASRLFKKVMGVSFREYFTD